MSDTDINATVNVTEDIYADVDSTAMSAAVIDDGDSIVVPAEVDFGQALDTELEDNDLIDVPVDESVGIAGDHRVLLHRDAANQHPMSAITGLNETIAGINTALSDRITQVEAETADLDVDMASALLRIGDLQDQVDGNITTWFYAAEPAMNLPPVALDPSNPHDTGWDTIDKKNAHRGDLYYNTLTGYAYRFAYADGDFGWMRITDTDVVRALADAARAQDTADSKRRVFYTTPYPPYDKGDLWVQGTSGDILVCNTSKAAGEAYDFADWARASKYTDDTVADIALASANGKNTVYHQASQPTGGTYKKGDTWFDTDDDYTMYTYDGSVWVKEQFGNEAIADLSITNAKIANATIEYGKIKSIDAGKITVGDIAAVRMKTNSIEAINANTGTVKISADKVNIDGAAIFTSGRLSETSLDNTYDANGAAADALSDAKDYADDSAADALADAKTYADGAVSDKAGKSDAVARQQRIYYRKTASGAPSKNTTWLSTSGTGYGNWSLKIPQMTSGSTKYPYLYTAVQTQTVTQKAAGNTCTCSDVLLDDTTTVIDGGTIITGTVNANAVNASSGTFDTANIPNLNASKITAGDISADRMKINSISAINSNTGSVKISASKVEIDGTATFNAIKSSTDAAYDSKGSASAVQTNLNNLEIGGRNLVLGTGTPAVAVNASGTNKNIPLYDFSDSAFGEGRLLYINSSGYYVVNTATISFDWETTDTTGTFIVSCNQTPWRSLSPTITVSNSNQSGHVEYHHSKWTSTYTSIATTGVRIRTDNMTGGKTITIKNLKVELGNKATDWTPAPEDSLAEEQRIYYRSNSTSTPSAPSTWVTSTSTANSTWTTKRMQYDSTYKYLYTCIQQKTAGGNVTNSTVLLDDTTTVIDGGNIITGTVTANQLAANAVTADKIAIGAIEEYENILLDSDAPTLTKVKASDDRYWSDGGNDKIVCSHFSLTDAPEKGLKYGRRFVYDGSVATNNYFRGYAFYSNGTNNSIPLVPNQTYTATWWARCTSGSGRTRFLHSKGDGATGTVSGTIYTLSRYWKKYTYSFTFGSTLNTNYNRIWFHALFPTSTAGTVEICGCKLVVGADAESYITRIDNNGIRIHPSSTENNSVVINSDGMEVFKGGTGSANSVAKYGDTVRVGKESSGYAILDSEGMEVYQNGTSVAHYGEYARVGKDGEANTTISTNEVTISASNDIAALRVTPDGNTQTVTYSKSINQKISASGSYTYTHPSAASNGRVNYRLVCNGSSTVISVTKGQTTSATTVTSPFKFKYSATTSAITITNNESSQYIILDEVSFRKTSTSPLIEVGGVITLGQYPDVGLSTRLVVGNGTADTAVSNAFEVDSYGNVYANGSLYTTGGTTEISKFTVVFGQKNDGTEQGYIYQWKSGSVTSNSSGLINLSTAFGIDYNNATGITVNCVTSNYKVSGVTAWNGAWYGILSPYNSAAVSANTTVNLIVSWFRSAS